MLSPLVPLSELARRTIGAPDGIDPTSTDGVRAMAALEDASWLAREAAGRITDADWPTEESVPYPVRVVVLRAARRGWENPEGTTSESVSSSGVSSSREAEPNSVYLTEDEARQCARFSPGASQGRGRATSVPLHDPALDRLFRSRWGYPTEWAPLSSEQTP